MNEAVLQQLYDLSLNPATRDWERQQINAAKRAIEGGASSGASLATLEAALRPLAVRQNLTPAVADWYAGYTGDAAAATVSDLSLHDQPDPAGQARAILAGGCFWCMVEPFVIRPGIRAVISGYTGGQLAAPTYEQVSTGATGHVEAVEIIYDTALVSYQDLLDVYWQLIDPTDGGGQINDRGTQYRPVIFVQNAAEQAAAAASKQAQAANYAKPIAVAIEAAGPFWPAENYHQDYYRKHPREFKAYEAGRTQWLAWLHLQTKLRRLTRRQA
ncbi:peptide-methionine (S)-S-oxide reductase MsrA [Lacticaseibacillus nasuensis]|uniref:peptide-methionine (S)-S-oxide reductase MsrA n=1 Tax=Lacticaseibacillus nasuensis TaxID=944671 RepID=UPI002245A430|nr:peptide-methionine (S)-S-oxide reductase MsrA [Lacticaseibacillus nasuensis]MCX2454765.1 peptide-methionine (S)-S-oxide reductase MsrA [Lacticaseibacillus nasuensis]